MGTGRVEDQDLPVPNDGPYVQELIHDQIENYASDPELGPLIKALQDSIEARRALGEKRYGVPGLQPNNGRNTLRDVFEEVLDAMIYARSLAEETGDQGDYTLYENLLAEAVYLQKRISDG